MSASPFGNSGEKSNIFIRCQWVGIDGAPYFTWKSANLPNWFDSRSAVSNECERLSLTQNSYVSELFHYTSLEGFMGIVRGRSMWLTDYGFLNDSRELVHGIELSQELISSQKNLHVSPQAKELLESWASRLNQPFNKVYVASFTSEDDSLSQWRAYGPIAISFKAASLGLFVNQSTLRPIIYDESVQRKIIEVFINHNVEAFRRDSEAQALTRIPDVYRDIDALIQHLAFFKNHAFSSEKEYRLAFIDNPELFSNLGEQKIKRNFRSARGRIIPYLSSADVLTGNKSMRPFPLQIEKVILGPECDPMLDAGVREFLVEHGLESVEIMRSTVPLR